MLASGQLGSHKGLPVTIVVSTTLKELESGRGQAVTGGGSLLPMSEVIRQASAAHHYLVVFDNHTECPLYLGRSRRLASAAQRIVLYACAARCPLLLWPLPGGRAPRSRKSCSDIHRAPQFTVKSPPEPPRPGSGPTLPPARHSSRRRSII